MFKTSAGKYIVPQVMESKFRESVVIEQLMVVGKNQKFPGAIIIPSFDGLRDYEMIENPDILEKIQREVDELNKYFPKWEQIKKFKLLPVPWQVDSGEMTTTMKLERKVIKVKYEKEIFDLYVL